MLNVCCVAVNLESYMDGQAVHAVEVLYSMVRRNLQGDMRGRFTVFTDRPSAFENMAGVQTKLVPPGVTGWWAKLFCFSPDAFPAGERVLYFDLDTVITGPLDEIAAYDGDFAILRDVYRPKGLQSSVMAWQAGAMNYMWTDYVKNGYPQLTGGDQEWIENVGYVKPIPAGRPTFWSILQDIFPGLFRSYKLDCTDFVPKGTSVVFFHGLPRPHQVTTGWVPDVWRITDEKLFFSLNVKEEQVRANIKHALTKPNWITKRDGLQTPALIVGGGPSLAGELWRIRGHQLSGGVVFATNNTARYLQENGITADCHVMHDARAANLAFVASTGICYYASQCHPSVLDAAGERLVCWHPYTETCLDVIQDDPKGPTMVAGGSTVGLNAIALAYILGHRQFMLFGFDSSYEHGAHHAYAQTLNDGELLLKYEVGEQVFECAPWMIQQAEQFLALGRRLTQMGCSFEVYGHGMLPTLVCSIVPEPTAADLRAKSILERLTDRLHPIGAEIGVFAGELSQRLLRREDLSLYMVDSWATSAPDSAYAQSDDFHASLSQTQQERYYGLAKEVVGFAGPRAKIVRKPSVEAARDIPDASLDFVFIDAAHDYEGCKADIEAWAPKVKRGGLIAGHDYENVAFPKFGVKRAVDEKFPAVDLGDNYTWFVRI
jgi:uncharacterized Rossmann fold enzyme